MTRRIEKDYWAALVEYDCRIVFAYAKNPEYNEDIIVLIDIGTHDNVYYNANAIFYPYLTSMRPVTFDIS